MKYIILLVCLYWTLIKIAIIQCQGIELEQPNNKKNIVSSTKNSTTTTTTNGLRQCNSDFAIDVNRIFGGEDAKPMEFPHMASLQVRYFDSHTCGATLITNRWLLCAAHCFLRNDYPYAWQIKVGEYNLRKKDQTERLMKIDKIILHEKYDRKVQIYDIALIRLKDEIDMEKESHLKTVCLAKENDVARNDYECVATGWGRGNKAFGVLQKLPQPLHNNTVCKKIWKNSEWPITENHICIGDLKGGKGVCNGDSGGPVQCRLKNGEWVQFGVASWTISNCIEKNYAAMFTKVSSYRQWIIDTIAKNSN